MLALLLLSACNGIAFIVLIVARQTTTAKLAFLTCMLMIVTLVFTNWGFSMPNPRIRVFWGGLFLACISQVALLMTPIWFARPQHVGG